MAGKPSARLYQYTRESIVRIDYVPKRLCSALTNLAGHGSSFPDIARHYSSKKKGKIAVSRPGLT
jgi:hypothetical protein